MGISEGPLYIWCDALTLHTYVHSQVANADVRANAACLFLDTFPLQVTDSTREERDVMLQKQFDILKVSSHHAVSMAVF